MREKDLIIINNCPSFYKVNLYNELALQLNIFVIFIGISKQVVIYDTFQQDCKFDYQIISKQDISKRNKIKIFFEILKILKKFRFSKIIYGGYNLPEFILLSFIFPKYKNVLQTESASESILRGWRFWMKKIIISRFSAAIASGKIHKEVLLKMGFKRKIIISKGVGILNKQHQKVQRQTEKPGDLNYLYVGRLIDIKNVDLLVEVFNKNGRKLSIVGNGVLEKQLREKANSNIQFLGFCKNEEIAKLYKDHDVFILPSYKEPWGLVVEEALYWGCTLLLSENIGSVYELLTEPDTGIIFNPKSKNGLSEAVERMEKEIEYFQNQVQKFDIDMKDKTQIDAYVQVLN